MEKLNFSITKGGVALSESLYSWNEETRTLSTNEGCLVLDFRNISNCTFKTGSYCTFDTGSNCIFDTGSNCTFDTGSGCTFKTDSYCVVIRRDIYQVIELTENQKIKLYGCGVIGFDILNENDEKKAESIKKANELLEQAKLM